ncbi:unnamed protein product [Owenia fusiformis]|uniref:Uncharacterized protein n=1 Tax=Owenia fusiformis TaxID=6347 RepID=A0A8J1UJ12_OWEFU|nr:unnamed protein product [Owenia fusiformis]
MSSKIEEYLYPTDKRRRRPVSLASDVRKEAIRLNILEESYKLKHKKQIEREIRYFTNDLTHQKNVYSLKLDKLQRRKTEIQEERRDKGMYPTAAEHANNIPRPSHTPLAAKYRNEHSRSSDITKVPKCVGVQNGKSSKDFSRSDVICTFSVQGDRPQPFVVNPFVKPPHHLKKLSHNGLGIPSLQINEMKVYRIGKHKNLIKDNDMLKLVRSKTLGNDIINDKGYRENVKRVSDTQNSEKGKAHIERLESINEVSKPMRNLPRSMSDPTHNTEFFVHDQFKKRPTLTRSISSQSDVSQPSRRLSMVYNSLPIYFRSSTAAEQFSRTSGDMPSNNISLGVEGNGTRTQERMRRRSTGSSTLTAQELIQQEPYRKVSTWQNFVHPK